MDETDSVRRPPEGEDTGVDPLLKAVGKQIKRLREQAGLSQAGFGERIGYGAEQVSSVERGRRAPKAQFIQVAERVLDARGVLEAVKEDVERARLPARFRDFAKWEKDAVSVYAYAPLTVPGLLQTEAYARGRRGDRTPHRAVGRRSMSHQEHTAAPVTALS